MLVVVADQVVVRLEWLLINTITIVGFLSAFAPFAVRSFCGPTPAPAVLAVGSHGATHPTLSSSEPRIQSPTFPEFISLGRMSLASLPAVGQGAGTSLSHMSNSTTGRNRADLPKKEA